MAWGTRVLYFPTQPHTDHYLALPDCHLVPQVETARRKEYETRKDLQVRAVRRGVLFGANLADFFLGNLVGLVVGHECRPIPT